MRCPMKELQVELDLLKAEMRRLEELVMKYIKPIYRHDRTCGLAIDDNLPFYCALCKRMH